MIAQEPIADLKTHQVTNQVPPLLDYNLFDSDPGLQAASTIPGHISSFCAPTYNTHGTLDPLCPYSQGQELDDALTSVGVLHTFESYVGGHVYDNVSDADKAAIRSRILNFMLARLS